MDMIDLGKKIRKLRKEHKMTQAALGELLNVSDKTVSKWEKNDSIPDIAMIKKISEIFEVPIESLLDESALTKSRVTVRKHIISISKFVYKYFFQIIFAIIFFLLLIYFVNNYNAVKIYNIKINDENIFVKESYFIESNEKNFIIISDINIYKENYDIAVAEVQLYTLVNGDRLYLGGSDDLSGIIVGDLHPQDGISLNEILDGIKKGLYLSIDIIDTKGKNHNYEIKFDTIKCFSNNKFIYSKIIEQLENTATPSSYDIPILTEDILLNNGFTKDKETGNYVREDKNRITVDLKDSKMKIIRNIKKNQYVYTLNYSNNTLNFKLMDNNTTIVYYQYSYNKEELICLQGNCDSYKEDMEYALDILKSLK